MGEKVETMADFIFLGSKITAVSDWNHEIKRHLLLGRNVMTNVDRNIKKQRYHFADKCLHSQSYGFSRSHVWMWELGHKENWALKNLRFWTVVLVKTFDSPLDCKEIQLVNPKGNQPWIFIGRTDVEAPILWPPDVKNRLMEKTWCWERSKAGGEGDDRGWDGWMVSPTWWTWVWASSGS